jgi:hypothetical protein
LATRPVRVVLLAGGLLFAKGAGLGDFEFLAPAIYAMAGLTVFTVGQRIWHVRQQLAGEGPPPGGVTSDGPAGTRHEGRRGEGDEATTSNELGPQEAI